MYHVTAVAGTQLLALATASAQRVGECCRHGFSVSMAGGEWGLESCLDYTLSEVPKDGLELQAVLRWQGRGQRHVSSTGSMPEGSAEDCLKSETSILVPVHLTEA